MRRDLLAVGVGLAVALISGDALDRRSTERGGFAGDPLEMVALGGFRPLAIDLVQARADLDLKRGRFFPLLADLDLLLELQPRNDQLWAFTVYHMAVTVPSLEVSWEAQWSWIRLAIGYAKKGLQRFPDSSIVPFQLGFVCAVVVPRDAALVDAFMRSEGRSPLTVAVEAFHRAVAVAPSVKPYWLWEIVGRRGLAMEAIRVGHYAQAGREYESIRGAYRSILARFRTNEAIVSGREPENADDWIDVCRCLEEGGAGSTEARERLLEMRDRYSWDPFPAELLSRLEHR